MSKFMMRSLRAWIRIGTMKFSVGYLVDVISVLTEKELKVRYKSSFLGYLWSIANPLLFALIYYFIFKLVMRVQIPDYTVFLITGLFPWQWFASSIGNSLFSFISNAQIIKKTVFPRSIIPFCNVFMEFLHFLCTIPVIVVFLFIYDMTPSWSWLWGIPLISLAQMLLTLGLSLALSSLNLFFRDLERFIPLGIMLMFYCTPILYSSDLIPEKYHWMLNINPISEMMLAWRDLFMKGIIHYNEIASMYMYALIFLAVGSFIFNKLKFRFAEIL